jgi:hypothetical protein
MILAKQCIRGLITIQPDRHRARPRQGSGSYSSSEFAMVGKRFLSVPTLGEASRLEWGRAGNKECWGHALTGVEQ